ncbi:radial spoke head 10 homolog B isoform X2 [Pungitius pungitius]|uniref:radial spoke head 10 homolog B isoform X2 n=1 Tax=Pungitius pungitius TaxID=134920 RepID=UPI002E14B0EB
MNNQRGNETTRGHVEQVSEVRADVNETQTQPEDERDDIHEIPTLLGLTVRRCEGGTCAGCHGEGVVYFEGGHIYKGTLSRGLMDGRGVFTAADGLKYDGEFVCNMPSGRGTYTWPDGSSYEGEVRGGVRHGTGTYRCEGGSYTGQWAQGRRHGQGVVYYTQNKTSWYNGDWVRNTREGRGVRRYPSGNVYSGEWKSNLRHGEGTMTWLNVGQCYVGTWRDGVQVRERVGATRRADGSWCWHRRTGDIVQGPCEEERRRNQTHGEVGSQSVHVASMHTQTSGITCAAPCKDWDGFEGEMMTLDLTGDTASSALPDVPLDIERLLERIPETERSAELKQVEFAVLRRAAELTSLYSFYSGLGRAPSPDDSLLLSRLQLWRLLKDCKVHHHGISLAQLDRFVGEDAPPAETHSPFAPIRLRRLLSCLVIVAFHLYHEDAASEKHLLAACFSTLMTDNILPNYKEVKGFVFGPPDRGVGAASYCKESWDVYRALDRAKVTPRGRTMTCRHLLWMFKDLRLLDSNLTPARLLQIITAESRDCDNPSACLDMEITFLEFFEVLLGSAEATCQRGPDGPGGGMSSPPGPEAEATEDVTQGASPPSSPIAPDVCSSTSVETKSRDAAEMSTDQDAEKPPSAGQSSDKKEEPSRGAEARGCEVELWKQTIHRFFRQVFFPAFEHHQLVSRRNAAGRNRDFLLRQRPPQTSSASTATHS